VEGVVGSIGCRILVIGMAGAGKSMFSRALSARTGLPVIHLDFHYWKPGWVKPSEDEWREKQRGLLAGSAWIADGNDLETLDVMRWTAASQHSKPRPTRTRNAMRCGAGCSKGCLRLRRVLPATFLAWSSVRE
jgi:hypothetical protein